MNTKTFLWITFSAYGLKKHRMWLFILPSFTEWFTCIPFTHRKWFTNAKKFIMMPFKDQLHISNHDTYIISSSIHIILMSSTSHSKHDTYQLFYSHNSNVINFTLKTKSTSYQVEVKLTMWFPPWYYSQTSHSNGGGNKMHVCNISGFQPFRTQGPLFQLHVGYGPQLTCSIPL